MKRQGDTSTQSAAETTIASAATTDLGTSKNRNILISGTTAITSFGTGVNKEYLVRFAGALTLTYNSTSLILPGAANIVTVAGDTAIVTSDASGNWNVRNYQRGEASASNIWSNLLGRLIPVVSLWASQAWTTIATSTTPTIDGNTGVNFKFTPSANSVFQTPTNMKPNQSGVIKIISGGNFTTTFNSSFNWGTAGAPTFNTTAGKLDYITYFYDADSSLMVMGLFNKAA